MVRLSLIIANVGILIIGWIIGCLFELSHRLEEWWDWREQAKRVSD